MMRFDDRRMFSIRRRLRRIYTQAKEELTGKINSFFADFDRLDQQKQELVAAGKLSEATYKTWRKNKILMSEKYMDLRDTITDNLLHANQLAAAYINSELPTVYAHNFNNVGKAVASKIRGYSFDLTNVDTVRTLSMKQKTLLPYKVVDGRKDVRWNTKRVNSQILQGVLQGESVDKMAKRLMNVTTMNEESALRNARTAVTSAQNKGRVDAMKQAVKDGVIMKKEWIATKDERTRQAHLDLDRVQVDVGEAFENSIGPIMFPGDPNADPSNSYNCRCTVAEVVIGFRKKEGEDDESDDDE